MITKRRFEKLLKERHGSFEYSLQQEFHPKRRNCITHKLQADICSIHYFKDDLEIGIYFPDGQTCHIWEKGEGRKWSIKNFSAPAPENLFRRRI